MGTPWLEVVNSIVYEETGPQGEISRALACVI
jgi:hypothetical protein